MTCAHVVAQTCNHSTFRASLQTETLEPDVALLVEPTHCFSFHLSNKVVPVDSKAATLLDDRTWIKVPDGGGRGKIYSIVEWVRYDGRRHIFPHVEIISDVKLFWDLLIWPPWRVHFGREGHSGSWIVDRRGNWLGFLLVGTAMFG